MSFMLGQVLTSSGIFELLEGHPSLFAFINKCILRHKAHDWGDIGPEDAVSNVTALEGGGRLFSIYTIPSSIGLPSKFFRIWIITEAVDDKGLRASTTVLFPHEY